MAIKGLRRRLAILAVIAGLVAICDPANSDQTTVHERKPIARNLIAQRLASAYPEAIARADGGVLIWHDGTSMDVSPEGAATQTDWRSNDAAWLNSDDLAAILLHPYPGLSEAGHPTGDPGRSRPPRFFKKLYGDCRDNRVQRDLVQVAWLPKSFGPASFVRVTNRQGVATRVAAISAALDALPAAFHVYLRPLGGGFACRSIAGTQRLSAHGYGIAIDLAVDRSDYWRWAKSAKGTTSLPTYRNRIPLEIVRIFEAHGFIWGGAWRHFDTMHFEYRPEFFVSAKTRIP